MLEGAYWVMDLPEVRVLSVNTNYWRNKETRDSKAQSMELAWIKSNLEVSRKQKKKVLIATHIPFHYTAHYATLGPLLKEYRDIVSIVICGHVHAEHFYVSNSQDVGPYGNEIAAQALSSQNMFSPGISVFNINTENEQFEPMSFQQYGFELGRTYNRTDLNMGGEYWKLTFDSEKDLGLPNLTAPSLYDFTQRIKTDLELNMKFDFFHYNHRPLALPSFATIPGEWGYLHLGSHRFYMFHWLFRAKKNSINTPLVIFLDGGPGCGSELHLLNGIGPKILGLDGVLSDNQYSWDEIANVLLIDQPIGSGLSAKIEESNDPKSMSSLISHLTYFFQSFYKKYPEFSHRATYIVAHDYAFHYIPYLLDAITKHNIPLSVRGIGLVNPLIWGGLQFRDLGYSGKELGILDSFPKYAVSQLAGEMSLLLSRVGLENSGLFSAKITEGIVRGIRDSNLEKYDFPHILDPQLESRLHTFMNTEISKTPLANGYPYSRCSSEIARIFAHDLLLDYSSQLKTILDLRIPVTIIFGQNDLFTNLRTLNSIFSLMDWQFSNDILNGVWKERFIDGKVRTEFMKVQNLKLFKVLEGGHYPLIHNPQVGFDILASLLFG